MRPTCSFPSRGYSNKPEVPPQTGRVISFYGTRLGGRHRSLGDSAGQLGYDEKDLNYRSLECPHCNNELAALVHQTRTSLTRPPSLPFQSCNNRVQVVFRLNSHQAVRTVPYCSHCS